MLEYVIVLQEELSEDVDGNNDREEKRVPLELEVEKITLPPSGSLWHLPFLHRFVHRKLPKYE